MQAALGNEVEIGRLYANYRSFALPKGTPIKAVEQLRMLNGYAGYYRQLITGVGDNPIVRHWASSRALGRFDGASVGFAHRKYAKENDFAEFTRNLRFQAVNNPMSTWCLRCGHRRRNGVIFNPSEDNTRERAGRAARPCGGTHAVACAAPRSVGRAADGLRLALPCKPAGNR